MKRLSALSTIILVISAASPLAAKTVIKGKLLKTVTVTGYLSDVFSATRDKDLELIVMKKEPEKHTVRVSLLPPCAGSGYGIMVNYGTAEFKNYMLKYKFDKNGNALAQKFLKGLKRKADLLVTVTGKDNNGTLIGITIKDAK